MVDEVWESRVLAMVKKRGSDGLETYRESPKKLRLSSIIPIIKEEKTV